MQMAPAVPQRLTETAGHSAGFKGGLVDYSHQTSLADSGYGWLSFPPKTQRKARSRNWATQARRWVSATFFAPSGVEKSLRKSAEPPGFREHPSSSQSLSRFMETQTSWDRPVIPALQEAEAGSLKLAPSLDNLWTWQDHVSKQTQKRHLVYRSVPRPWVQCSVLGKKKTFTK